MEIDLLFLDGENDDPPFCNTVIDFVGGRLDGGQLRGKEALDALFAASWNEGRFDGYVFYGKGVVESKVLYLRALIPNH